VKPCKIRYWADHHPGLHFLWITGKKGKNPHHSRGLLWITLWILWIVGMNVRFSPSFLGICGVNCKYDPAREITAGC
jgi:hypothetical protein